MAQVLKVGSVNLSAYVRVAHEDGLDPANSGTYSEPQFTGAPAFSEGQSFVGDAVSNRLMSFPLILKAGSTDALYQLVRDINGELVKGAQVEYRSGGATQSTFFDLERGRLEPQFEFWLDQASRVRAMLHLWVRPYGTAGTMRLIASVPMGSAAAVTFPATGVIGDEMALANLEVQVGSAVASQGRVVMWGVHPHPSFNPIHAATSGLAQSGATVRGASGAIASQYTAIPVSPTGASGIAYTAYLEPVSAHIGRHRVIAIGRSGLNVPIPLYAEDRFGAVLGPTALASQTDVNKWQVIDLGEVQVPARASGQEAVPTQYVNIYGGGAPEAVPLASPAFHLNSILFLPLDYSAGLMRTLGGAGASHIYDSFGAFKTGRLYEQLLEEAPIAESGQRWSKVFGYLGQEWGEGFPVKHHSVPLNVVGATMRFGEAASGFYTLASGELHSNVTAKFSLQLRGGTPSVVAASQNAITCYAKYTPNGWAAAKVCLGPSPYMALISSADGVATTLQASAGMPTMLASGLLVGQTHNVVVKIQSGRADVWIATGGLNPSPALSASHANFGLSGWPGLEMNARTQNASSYYISVANIDLWNITGASDIAARESFRFESYPQRRTIQGNASVFAADRTAEYRGHNPQVPPMGSPAATGPARVVVFQGEIDNVIGNDGMNAVLSVRERFSYLR